MEHICILYVTYIDYILNIYCNNISVINIFNICTPKSMAPMNIYVQYIYSQSYMF